MVGENLKRSYPGHSPDPGFLSRKIGRFDHGSGYLNQTSNPSSRRSSMAQVSPSHQIGYGTPSSRSPAENENENTLRHDMEDVPKALESFVVAISKHNQTFQHLKNVEADYENMLPRYKDFPSLGTQKTTRLSLAQKDLDITQAQKMEATSILLEALKGYFTAQVNPASHQDCVSRSELNAIRDQFRNEKHELDQLRAENHELKSRLSRLEDRHNREVSATKKSDNRISKLEDFSRTTTNAVNLATDNYKLLHDQTSRDRLSYRDRLSTLEVEMDKNKTKHKEIGHAIDGIRSSLDHHIDQSNTTHQQQTQNIDLCRSKVEELQQKLDVEVDSKFKHNSEILAATCKEVKDLKQHPTLLSSPPPAAPTSIPSHDPVKAESRLKAVEQQMQDLDEEASVKNLIFADEIDKLRSSLNNLQAELNKMQDKAPRKQEEEFETFTAWKDLKSRVEDLASSVNDLSANTTRIEDLTLSTKGELETSINEVKQVTSQGVPEAMKPQLDYISKTIENHIDLLQRHEIRLNSVTTDELCKMMENQWRSAYGIPTELRGIVQRQAQLETLTRGRCDDLNKRVLEMTMKYEGMAMEFRNRELYLFYVIFAYI